MRLDRVVNQILTYRRKSGAYITRIAPSGQSIEEIQLLAALEAERDPPLTDREWAQEESARARYARKGSGARR